MRTRLVAWLVSAPVLAGTRGVSADCIKAQRDTTPDGPDVLLQSELGQIIRDPAGFYVNVHNEPFPGGAVRGQLR